MARRAARFENAILPSSTPSSSVSGPDRPAVQLSGYAYMGQPFVTVLAIRGDDDEDEEEGWGWGLGEGVMEMAKTTSTALFAPYTSLLTGIRFGVYAGGASNKPLFKAMRDLSKQHDPGAPIEATPEQKLSIESRRDVTERRERFELAKLVRDKEISKAKGALDQRRRVLYNLLVQDARAKYFAEVKGIRPGLNQHYREKRIDAGRFDRPFPCRQCLREGVNAPTITGLAEWRDHIEEHHGEIHAPTIPRRLLDAASLSAPKTPARRPRKTAGTKRKRDETTGQPAPGMLVLDFSGKLPRKKKKKALGYKDEPSPFSTCEPVVQHNPLPRLVDSRSPPLSEPMLEVVTTTQSEGRNDNSDLGASSSDRDSCGGFSQASFDNNTPTESPVSSTLNLISMEPDVLVYANSICNNLEIRAVVEIGPDADMILVPMGLDSRLMQGKSSPSRATEATLPAYLIDPSLRATSEGGAANRGGACGAD